MDKQETSPGPEESCFVICPLGQSGSETRSRSDAVLRIAIAPAAAQHGLRALRSDKIATPGNITADVIGHLLNDKLVIADLSGSNPNVFYELGIRHASGKPVILLMQAGEALPFNVFGLRAISYDPKDPNSLANACDELKAQLTETLRDAHVPNSPVHLAKSLMDLGKQSGSTDPTRDLIRAMNTQLESLHNELLDVRQHLVRPEDLKDGLPAAYRDHVEQLLRRYSSELDLLRSVREAGITGVFKRRQAAIRAFSRALDEEAKEIVVIGSSLYGLLQKPDFKEIAEKLRFKQRAAGASVKFMLTHPIFADFRATQETRSASQIGGEVIKSLKILKEWDVSPASVRLYLGTPTCFAIKTTRAMLLNPYPYVSVSYESPCVLLETSENLSGTSGYFFEEFNDRHFRAWDTELAVPVQNYDLTINSLARQLPVYDDLVKSIIARGKSID